jgi:hypothetical protein
MDIDNIAIALGAANSALALGTVIYVWLTARSKANTESIEHLKDDIGRLKDRAQRVETTIQHMPDKSAVHDLALAVSEIRGAIGAQGEKLSGVERTTRRIEDFLMQASRS